MLSSNKERSRDSAFYFLKSAFNVTVTDIPLINNDDIKLNVIFFKILNILNLNNISIFYLDISKLLIRVTSIILGIQI